MTALAVTQTQNLQTQGVAVLKGITGFSGISAAIDGTTASTLDVTVTATGWAQLVDGTILYAASPSAPVPVATVGAQSTALVSTSFTGLTSATGSPFTLWLDKSADGLNGPLWTIQSSATAAPTVTAIQIATFAVSGSVIVTGSVVVFSQPYTSFLLHENITFASPTTVVVGTLPANAIIDQIVLGVATVFNGSSPTISLGFSGTTTAYLATSAAPATATVTVPATQTVGTAKVQTTAKTVLATMVYGTSTAGAMDISIYYHQP